MLPRRDERGCIHEHARQLREAATRCLIIYLRSSLNAKIKKRPSMAALGKFN